MLPPAREGLPSPAAWRNTRQCVHCHSIPALCLLNRAGGCPLAEGNGKSTQTERYLSQYHLADLRKSGLSDETIRACALTYISDMFTGLASVPGIDQVGPSPASTTRSGFTGGPRWTTTGC